MLTVTSVKFLFWLCSVAAGIDLGELFESLQVIQIQLELLVLTLRITSWNLENQKELFIKRKKKDIAKALLTHLLVLVC